MRIDEIKGFVSGRLYQELSADIKSVLPIKTVSVCSDTMASLDMQRIKNANLSAKELQDALLAHRGDVMRFSVNKFKRMQGVEDVEEYPVGEAIEEKPVTVETLGYSQGFLLMNLIEYVLTDKGIHALEAYFKKSRIPQAKGYAKEVLDFLGGDLSLKTIRLGLDSRKEIKDMKYRNQYTPEFERRAIELAKESSKFLAQAAKESEPPML